MSKLIKFSIIALMSALIGCKSSVEANKLVFATSAEYPPFEYRVNGELQGFDIDLARLIAQEMGKEAHFKDMQFSAILPTVQNGHVDAAIATITVTQDRKQHFDFSQTYYFDGVAAVFKENHPIKTKADLSDKKIACQLGSTMEIWAKKNGLNNHLIVVDNNNQAIEALKAGHVDVVLIDRAQANIFSQRNAHLTYQLLEKSEDGYAVATPKGSPLVAQINQAIANLKQKGEIAKLEEKWLQRELP